MTGGRLGWWENSPTTHADLRSAYASALTRTVDVDEDTGVPPVLGLPRTPGPAVETGLTAVTAAIAQVPLHPTPRGWELGAHASLAARRSRGVVREQLDLAEELLPGRVERVMLHVTGPWTFGATVEYRGRAVVADRPAFRDCALTLGEGVAEMRRTVARAARVPVGDVSVAVHEPSLGAVLDGLPGPTDFDGLDPVDRSTAAAVLRRFLGQVRGTDGEEGDAGDAGHPAVTVLDPGPLAPWALTALGGDGGAGADRLVVPGDVLAGPEATTSARDAVAELVEGGQGIGWAVRTSGRAPSDAPDVAREVLRQWDRWTFDPDLLAGAVDLVVPEPARPRTPAEASEAAALVRTAAALLHRN